MLFRNKFVSKFYDILHNQEEYYNIYYKVKKSGNRHKSRQIVAPTDEYKKMQLTLNNYILKNNLVNISKYSYAWRMGYNVRDCAEIHIDQKYLLEVDIKNFFPSIKIDHILELFKRVGINSIWDIPAFDIAEFLTIPDKDGNRFLPQGFVSSPIIANAVRYPIDVELADLCLENNWNLSIYGDNIFISGDSVPKNTIDIVIGILNKYGFSSNKNKCHISPYYRRQSVLGITVNKKISISKDYYKNLISDLLDVLNAGEDITDEIWGKINYLRLSDNPRDFKYALKINKIIKEKNGNGLSLFRRIWLSFLSRKGIYAISRSANRLRRKMRIMWSNLLLTQ